MNCQAAGRLLILDCDGVLIRSEDANLAYYNHLFAAFGLPAVGREDTARLRQLHTLSTPQVIETFFPDPVRAAVWEFAVQTGFEAFVALVRPEPGWGEVLDHWRERGGVVAVATNRGASAAAVLDEVGLLGRVHHLVTVQDVARPKPHPDLLYRALELASVPVSHSLYVGDSGLDREAAARAQMPFLGFRLPTSPSVDCAEAVGSVLQEFACCRSSATLHAVVP